MRGRGVKEGPLGFWCGGLSEEPHQLVRVPSPRRSSPPPIWVAPHRLVESKKSRGRCGHHLEAFKCFRNLGILINTVISKRWCIQLFLMRRLCFYLHSLFVSKCCNSKWQEGTSVYCSGTFLQIRKWRGREA